MYVPDDSKRKLEKALESEVDALILDLEDAVADQRKEVAREMVPLSGSQQSRIGSQRSGPIRSGEG